VAAGQEMLLYCEVVNFVSERQEDGSYLIDMPLTLEIYEGDRRVWSWDAATVDNSLNRRNDHYIATRFYVPAKLRPGEYSLKVTVRDRKGNKSAKGEMPLVVKSL